MILELYGRTSALAWTHSNYPLALFLLNGWWRGWPQWLDSRSLSSWVSEWADGWGNIMGRFRSERLSDWLKSAETDLFCGDLMIKILLLTLTRLAQYLFYIIGKGHLPIDIERTFRWHRLGTDSPTTTIYLAISWPNMVLLASSSLFIPPVLFLCYWHGKWKFVK